MEITLVRACPEDAPLLQALQYQAFAPLLEKYQDPETNPATETAETIREKILHPDYDTYRIVVIEQTIDGPNDSGTHTKTQTIGGLRIARKNPGRYRLGRILVAPHWQGLGIAQAAVHQCEALYPDARVWELDTVAQEAKNCHLYEKLGYRLTGGRQEINERLTLVGYEKEVSP